MVKRTLVALLGATGLVLGLAGPASASGGDDGSQLALGDSVAFGYNPLVVAGGGAGDAGNFVGYPEIAAARLELRDVNAACPGEATGGFISLAGTDNGCRTYRFVYHFPLHVAYGGTQLAFALDYLGTHRHVRLVTIDLGANDVFALQNRCAGDPVCINQGLPGVLATIDANLRYILGSLRGAGHYHGRIVVLTYYSLAYDPASAAQTQALNTPILDAARANRARVADGFAAFQGPATAAGGSSCAAGLLIVLAPGVCDVHPTPKGRDLLAAAVVRAAGEEG